ncbi:PTS system mannose/fructose/sorbose family transporter subunit IID [Pelolinea submarina]|jgi:mannose/fructose/N-acetylgalactosamine-specific phosphotransferase system component IID|uniref:Mannose/fructose/N-acetylgalactosamine-specific phosphotransferase system component IID n=1 Tax=Pelolinea submarina TaxID=913107 RepID=A0A347ZR56_9CHLR|nr:PTS system mannose/fructose/sorbose family transporter subunit IID [Pelolinea submarina]REG11659.1 mannose/fructose/N-acetylgalactosamine-specific phosphotransferase system component IID [Pelolinea submarina]BBB47787.1 PTS system, mannose-specific IID component [Pelolinea submarina]
MATKAKITHADIMKCFWRYIFMSQCGWNYERMQSVGYCYSMLPVLKKMHPDPEDFKEAFITNLNFFNTNPVVGTPLIMGAHIALEEAGASYDTTEGLKVGLMGPLAGVGDTLVWALYNSIIFSIAAIMALNGNAMGPIMAMVLVFFPYMAIRYWQITWAYKEGTHLLTSIGSGAIGRITEFATIVGLIVIGGFAPSIVSLTTPLAYSQGAVINGETVTQTVTVQAQLDAILPYMLPVLATFLCYWLLKKKSWSPVKVILMLVVIGFIGGALGIFG